MKRILEIKKQIGNLSKNSENPFFKSAYLDLTELLNHIEPLLWEHNLVLIQPILDGKVCSIIMDEGGKTLVESHIDLPDINDPQKLGSAITYYRRYTLKSLLAIAEVDDDGNKASLKKLLVGSKEWHSALSKKSSIEALKKYFDIDQETEYQYSKALEYKLKNKQDEREN